MQVTRQSCISMILHRHSTTSQKQETTQIPQRRMTEIFGRSRSLEAGS